MNGADSLIKTLLASGIDVMFSNPGTAEMHIVESLDKVKGMRCILSLFEGAVTGAADGYGRMLDKPASTLLHMGPGMGYAVANLHNAKKARSPVVNVVGQHATYHLQNETPLRSDIEGLAKPVSHWVRTASNSGTLAHDAAQAVAEANSGGGKISTLIVPTDTAWGEASGPVDRIAPTAPTKVSAKAIEAAVKAIKSGKRTTLMITGRLLREKHMKLAAQIASATGIKLLAQQTNARVERGMGRVAIPRVPPLTEPALKYMADIENLILLGGYPPPSLFAYQGLPTMLAPPSCEVMQLAQPDDDLVHALEWLADELKVRQTEIKKEMIAGNEGPPPQFPTSGPLTAEAVCATVARLLPENAIISDEAVTSGATLQKYASFAKPHDFLQLTGGGIGQGMPVALGAAVACPDRKVVCLEGDGSGMYTLQALWTYAREKLDIVVVVMANRTYRILTWEYNGIGVKELGPNANHMFNIGNPDIDWVSMSKGMGVDAAAATTIEQFADLFGSAVKKRGPFLIEARLP